ncbi:four-carbon acid sugar kinase family protein [Desulfofundulus salinus]|uniref:Four-carbon acid sugar kinase family protein n=1 Tax=Desulfofundulus salinus TaxID=2419843 RepID=A0A494WSF1_9FIRM|nr:four-carbon acid sugar kinase family protein [Desulfofundulus salinum]RKO65791.1 four-carbon acid sugar kinase family protein [Desulfofundulus salinum]
MYRVIVIADDFTGANDSGAQLVKHGYLTVTVMDKGDIQRYEGVADALVIDTETRNIPALDAYEKLKEVSRAVKEYKAAIVYKKIDSTLRGNIGMELNALREVFKPELTVFAPAFPKNDRTTEEGIHFLRGIPVDKTELARDPRAPITTSNIRDYLENELRVKVRHVTLKEIRRNLEAVLLRELKDCDTFSFDAASDDDLIKIARGVLNLNKRTIWVGSAGLAEALIDCLKDKLRIDPVLVIAGSVSRVTRMQIYKALEDSSTELVKVDVKKSLISPVREIERVRSLCLEFMSSGKNVVIASAPDEDSIKEALEAGRQKGLSPQNTSEAISEVLGDIALSIVSLKKPAGMVLTGGDTAFHVVKKLSAGGCRIDSEIEPGLPELLLMGGPFHGLKLITKAGAFGSRDSILNAMRFLRGEGK